MALQGSRNGESLLADNMQDGVRIARDNPDSGVVVRIAGEGRPWNPGAITGGRVWGDIPDNSVQPGAGNGEPVTAEVQAQRQAEEAIRRETERRADEIVRKMAENKPDLPDGKTEQAVREIAGQERDRTAITEREPGNAVTGAGQRPPQCHQEYGRCSTPPTARFTPCQHLSRNCKGKQDIPLIPGKVGQIICELSNHCPSPQPVNGHLLDMRMTGQIQSPHKGKQRKGPTPGQKHPRLVQMQNAVCMVQHHQHQCHRFDDIPLSG